MEQKKADITLVYTVRFVRVEDYSKKRPMSPLVGQIEAFRPQIEQN